MKKSRIAIMAALISSVVLLAATALYAAVLTFDDIVSGETSYSYDGDSDGVNDATFSTTDPSGFNTAGPGPNMSYIQEPGIEGTVTLSPDLRVDFLNGASGSLSFGFALSSGQDSVTFTVYDAEDNVLATQTVTAAYTTPDGTNPSSFPEAMVNVSFSGTAAYATFDFENNEGRYIIDNFQGTFGSTEQVSIPTLSEWGMILFSALLIFVAVQTLRRHPTHIGIGLR